MEIRLFFVNYHRNKNINEVKLIMKNNYRSDRMKSGSELTKERLLLELDSIKSRVEDYDWDYRFSRFQERLENEKEEVSKIIKEIKTIN